MDKNIKSLLDALNFKFEGTNEKDYKELYLSLDRKVRDISYAQEKYRKEKLEELKVKNKYAEAQFYYGDDEIMVDGSCSLSSKEESEEFIKRLNNRYEHLHVLYWEGEGDYKIEPSMDYDRCGDKIYTSTYRLVRKKTFMEKLDAFKEKKTNASVTVILADIQAGRKDD